MQGPPWLGLWLITQCNSSKKKKKKRNLYSAKLSVCSGPLPESLKYPASSILKHTPALSLLSRQPVGSSWSFSSSARHGSLRAGLTPLDGFRWPFLLRSSTYSQLILVTLSCNVYFLVYDSSLCLPHPTLCILLTVFYLFIYLMLILFHFPPLLIKPKGMCDLSSPTGD